MNTLNLSHLEDFIKKSYSSLGPKFIMEKFGVSRGKVVGIAKRHKLKMSKIEKTKLFTKLREKAPEKFNVNHLNFETVKTPEIAYILGLLWADGTLNSCGRSHSVRCSIVDRDGLNVKGTFLSTGKWNVYHGKIRKNYPNHQPQTTFQTNNKNLFEFLKKMDYRDKVGVSPNKIIEIIPDNLKYYWWRGFFDGDGCVGTSGKSVFLTLSGPFNQNWKFIEILMKILNIKKYTIIRSTFNKKNHKSSRVSLYSKSEILKFMNYIYKNRDVDGIGLDRKYMKFKSCDFLYKVKPKSNVFYGISETKCGKYIARISKNSKIGIASNAYLGIFDDIDSAKSVVVEYFNKNNINIPEKFNEKIYKFQ